MCDKIKVTAGCGICEADDFVVEELEWYDNEKQCISNNDAMILMPFDTVLARMSVVCLSCVISIRNITVPTIGETCG